MELTPGGNAAGPTLLPQDKVRITSGLLAGLEGRVVSRPVEGRVLLDMDLQPGVLLEIDDTVLESR